MKHNIEIETNCKQCPYIDFKIYSWGNAICTNWYCRLFDMKLYQSNGTIAVLKEEIPEQCGDCRLLIKRHLMTPEFEG